MLLLVTAVNGVAEELFFRGASYAAVPRHPVAVTTAAYPLATLATGNVSLVFAAVILGVVVGLERQASGASSPDPHALHLVDHDAVRAAAALLARSAIARRTASAYVSGSPGTRSRIECR